MYFYVDDHTCRIWDVESGEERALFSLTSPGVSVKWIPNEPNKVAECSCVDSLLQDVLFSKDRANQSFCFSYAKFYTG